jgi:hypothetical protein
MSPTTELSSQDADLFIKHLDTISQSFATACKTAEADVAEALGADHVPEDVNRAGETLMGMLSQARREAKSQFAQLRAACADAIAAGNTW